MIIPVFLPNVGCKERCIYCDQSYITEQKDYDVEAYIKRSLENIRQECEIGIYGGNVFGIEREKLERILRHFEPFLERIKGMRISTRPISITQEVVEVLKLLQKYKLKVVELGIPTFNDTILQFLRRGHTVEELEVTYKYLKDKGLNVALQVMVGLPDETREDIKETVRNLLRLKPCYVRIYPLVIMKGTPIERMIYDGTVRLIDFDEAIRRTAYIYANAKKHGIEVLKVGLTDNKTLRENIVGGFYHPSFGYLIRCHIFIEVLKQAISNHSAGLNVTLTISRRDLPYIYGYRGENFKFLERKRVAVKVDESGLNVWEFILTDEKGLHFKGNVIQLFQGF